jgi:DNA-binding transcriptional ArsR family regulator
MVMMIFTALADPTRFHIVEMLAAQGSLPVTRIGKPFKISAPAISQHLKVLRDAKLVQVEVKAQQRIYSLDPQGMKTIAEWAAKINHEWEARFDALDVLLKQEMKKTRRRTK